MLKRLLERLGLRATLGTAWHTVRDRRRLQQEADVWLDYLRWQRQFGPIFQAFGATPGGRTVLVVSISDRLYQVKTECVLAKALQIKGLNPVILTHRGAHRAHRYFRAAGFHRFVYLDQFDQGESELARQVAANFLAGEMNVQTFKALKFHGAEVGRHVLSSVSRTLFEGAVELDTPRVRAQVAEMLPAAVRAVLTAERLLDSVKPDLVLFNEMGYTTFGGICDAAVARGLNVVQFVSALTGNDSLNVKRFTAETRRFHPQSVSDDAWQIARRIQWLPRYDEELRQEFERRYEGEGFLGRRTQSVPRVRGPEAARAELGIAPGRKVAVIFSHVLWDANMFYGEDLFDDQEQWFIESIRAAIANPALDWVIKLHPANVWKMRREQFGELGEKRAIRREFGTLPPHVKLLEPDADVNPFDLFELADYGLTIRGTIGIEMPCFGKPVLTAGTGRYSGRGFTLDSATREDYLAKLAHLQDYPPLTEERQLLAKKHAYVLFRVRPWKMQSLQTVYHPMPIGGHPLEQNMALRFRSPAELANAPDLTAFARWAANGTDLDYLQFVPPLEPSSEPQLVTTA